MKIKSRIFVSLLMAASMAWSLDASADALVRAGTEATKAKVKTFLNYFREDLGGGLVPDANDSYGGLRREINWDFVPAPSAAPNNLAANYFNSTNARGIVFSSPGTAFQVSAKAAEAAVNFGNINPAYATTFAPFTGDRLFTAVGSNVIDVDFFVPGTTKPATVKGFGAVFTDVDVLSSASIEYFDVSGRSLGKFVAPVSMVDATVGVGFSFLGVSFTTERVARVRITSGNVALEATTADSPPATDLVVLDDFIFGEPTEAPATTPITVITPNGGESVAIGAQLAITWNVSAPAGSVAIELSRNNGVTYEILTATTPDDGTENISVAGPPTSQALVRVRSLVDVTVSDVSNAAFAITGNTPPTAIPTTAVPTPVPSATPTATPTTPSAGTATPVITAGAITLSDLQASMTDAKVSIRNNKSFVTGSLKVTNSGQAATGVFAVDVFASTKKAIGAGATLIFRATQAALAPGATITIPFRYSLASTKRSVFLQAYVDSGGVVVETNEANNSGDVTAKAARPTRKPSRR